MKQYGVILADPPWDYDISHRNGAAKKHYNTMTADQLCALPIGDMALSNSVLLLWATWPKLLEAAFPLIDAWGFKYVTGIPWVKLNKPPLVDLFGELSIVPAFGTGYWARGATEPLLICKRGKPQFPVEQWAGVLCERMQHSRKPDSVYHYAESLNGPYLELFARRPRAGWDVWGNEVESTVTLEAA